MGEDGSFPDHNTHLYLLRHKLAVTTVHTVQPKWHPMAVSLYKFTEGVITRLVLLLMVMSFLSWFIYFFLFLTGRPPAATSIIVTSVTACSDLKRLTTKAKAITELWTCRFPCRGPVIQDLAPFSIWPEQGGRGIPSFQLAEADVATDCCKASSTLEVGTEHLKSIDLSVSKTLTICTPRAQQDSQRN